jgi:hypothetical protein
MLSVGSHCEHLLITGDDSDLCSCLSDRQVNVSGDPVFCMCNRRECWLCNEGQGVRQWWRTESDRFLCIFQQFLSKKTEKYIYRVAQEEGTKLWESLSYVKIYRYNPKHLYQKLNGYGDNGQRKVWSSGGCTHRTFSADSVRRVCPPLPCQITEILLTLKQ